MGTKRHIQNCRLNGPTGSIIDPSTARIDLRVALTVVEDKMTTSMKCPQCGLIQMRRPTCKACGAAMGEPASPSPVPPSAEDTAGRGAGGRMGTMQTLKWIFAAFLILVVVRMAWSPSKPLPEDMSTEGFCEQLIAASKRRMEELRGNQTNIEMEKLGISMEVEDVDTCVRRMEAKFAEPVKKRVIEVDPRVLRCLKAQSEAEHLRQLRTVEQRIFYCETLIELEKSAPWRLPW